LGASQYVVVKLPLEGTNERVLFQQCVGSDQAKVDVTVHETQIVLKDNWQSSQQPPGIKTICYAKIMSLVVDYTTLNRQVERFCYGFS
jgi:hypothetical protein